MKKNTFGLRHKINMFFGILISLIIFSIGYLHIYNKDVMYINTAKVFARFDLKKELEEELHVVEKKLEDRLNNKRNMLASMEQKMKSKETKEAFAEYNEQLKIYNNQELDFSKQITDLSEKYNQQIWQKLEEFITEFAKKERIKILVGNTGDKSILYSDDSRNITEECILFVNNKYAGK